MYVGVNRVQLVRLSILVSIPHVCGGEPQRGWINEKVIVYSPCMWG